MNWKRGFRRVTHVLAIIGAISGFFVGGFTAAGFGASDAVSLSTAILSIPVGYCSIWLIYYLIEWLVLGFYNDMPAKDNEIDRKKRRLIEISNMSSLQEQKKELDTLRKQIGASRAKEHRRGDDFTVGELIDNCHNALQTAAMIDMCKTAARNYKIALTATIIAILSMLGAWVAVLAG